MDTKKNMIIIKGEIKTPEIRMCNYNNSTGKFDILYRNGKSYSYAYSNVVRLSDPLVLTPSTYKISKDGRVFFDIEHIYVFKNCSNSYWHICFKNGSERDYNEKELKIVKSCLTDEKSKKVLEYLKQIAELSDLRNKETGEKLLAKKYEKMTFVGNDVALSKYLNPSFLQPQMNDVGYIPIFPFGCNNSQYKAVKRAMENQISVIQGPPGTGKTQTILNIIANILMQGKTVQVVSNNKSAIDNVYEKLSSPKYNLGFVAAILGSSGNKNEFIKNQDTVYPDFSSWKLSDNINDLKREINEKSNSLRVVFEKQERVAFLRQELSQLSLEFEYFKQYLNELNIDKFMPKVNKNISSKRWMQMWQKCQMSIEINNRIKKLLQIKLMIVSGISDWGFWKLDSSVIITLFQTMYYKTKQSELIGEIKEIEQYLLKENNDLIASLCFKSMDFLKSKLALKYDNLSMRRKFSKEDLWKNPDDILRQYPVILSTTFSSRSSLGKNVVYDYVIMDEASQVDIATGALALSCARNVVIVGDTKQLPKLDIPSLEYFGNNIIVDKYIKDIEIILKDIETIIKENIRKMEIKIQTPNVEVELETTENKFSELNDIITLINEDIKQYNEKIMNKQNSLRVIKNKFWNLMREKYDAVIESYEVSDKSIKKQEKNIQDKIIENNRKINEKKQVIADNQKKTVNIDVAIEHINQGLLDMGISGFSIVKHSEEEVLYRLKREDSDINVFKSLSEGEKMVISFLYFIECCKGEKKVGESNIICSFLFYGLGFRYNK